MAYDRFVHWTDKKPTKDEVELIIRDYFDEVLTEIVWGGGRFNLTLVGKHSPPLKRIAWVSDLAKLPPGRRLGGSAHGGLPRRHEPRRHHASTGRIYEPRRRWSGGPLRSGLPRKAGDRMMYTKEQREEQIKRMRRVSDAFYGPATMTGCHAFIEFTGFMNKFIDICRATSAAGKDFNESNTHTGGDLVVADHDLVYLAEKFDCIFGPTLSDPKKRAVFFKAMGWDAKAPDLDTEGTRAVLAAVKKPPKPTKALKALMAKPRKKP